MHFDKLLIANRGEIAARIERTARRLGIATVAVYTAADRQSGYVRGADQAYFLGEEPGLHLDADRLIEAALATGSKAIHPGYGFLAENADFAAACVDAGLVFVGPSAAAIRRLGDKAAAKSLATELGIPCVPGASLANTALEGAGEAAAAEIAASIGYPLLVKAAAGGGGRGMRVVERPSDLGPALQLAFSEAQAAFGRGDLLLESFLRGARHVEVQVLADRHGRVIHLGERDCSVQRRFQKLLEESPSPGVSAEQRAQLGEAATRLARAAGYEGAATVEMLLLPGGTFYFLEVNTRLQVEHGVTELLTGLDLVEWQLRIAAGEALPFSSEDLPLEGHAIEVRLCAEDPAASFLPQTGKIAGLSWPQGVRVDHDLAKGTEIGLAFDSMLAKILVRGCDREEARQRLVRALEGTFLAGISSNKSFLLAVLGNAQFAAGEVSTHFVAHKMRGYQGPEPPEWLLLLAAALDAERKSCYVGSSLWSFRSSGEPALFFSSPEVGGQRIELRIECPAGRQYRTEIADRAIDLQIHGEGEGWLDVSVGPLRRRVAVAMAQDKIYLDAGAATFCFTFAQQQREVEAEDPSQLRAPMASRVKALQVELGQEVVAGQPLLVLEAMKLEHRLEAAKPGRIKAIHVAVGEAVEHRQLLIELELPKTN